MAIKCIPLTGENETRAFPVPDRVANFKAATAAYAKRPTTQNWIDVRRWMMYLQAAQQPTYKAARDAWLQAFGAEFDPEV